LIVSCVDEDVRSFSLQDSPSSIKENVEVTVLCLEVRAHVGAHINSMRVSVPPKRYDSHVGFVSSIPKTRSFIEERGCDDEVDSIHEPSVVYWRRGVIP
jgi:hypothetical protein